MTDAEWFQKCIAAFEEQMNGGEPITTKHQGARFIAWLIIGEDGDLLPDEAGTLLGEAGIPYDPADLVEMTAYVMRVRDPLPLPEGGPLEILPGSRGPHVDDFTFFPGGQTPTEPPGVHSITE